MSGPGWNLGESSRLWGRQLKRSDGCKCWAGSEVLQVVIVWNKTDHSTTEQNDWKLTKMATASTMTSAAMPTPTATHTPTDSAADSWLSVTVSVCDTNINCGGVDIVTVGRYTPLRWLVHDNHVLGDAGGGCVVLATVDISWDVISTNNTCSNRSCSILSTALWISVV